MFGSTEIGSRARALGASLAFALFAGAFGTHAVAQDPLRVSI